LHEGLPSDARLLAEAAELVARGWCQDALAEDRHGHQVEPWSESACRWSPLGALISIWHESREDRPDVFAAAYGALDLATCGRVEEWNAAPWRTKWHVLSAFSRAARYLPQARAKVHGRD